MLELVVGNGLDGCMGPVGHAGERVLETQARLSREVAARSPSSDATKTFKTLFPNGPW